MPPKSAIFKAEEVLEVFAQVDLSNARLVEVGCTIGEQCRERLHNVPRGAFINRGANDTRCGDLLHSC